MSMADKYKQEMVPIARELADLGYKLVATCEWQCTGAFWGGGVREERAWAGAACAGGKGQG